MKPVIRSCLPGAIANSIALVCISASCLRSRVSSSSFVGAGPSVSAEGWYPGGEHTFCPSDASAAREPRLYSHRRADLRDGFAAGAATDMLEAVAEGGSAGPSGEPETLNARVRLTRWAATSVLRRCDGCWMTQFVRSASY